MNWYLQQPRCCFECAKTADFFLDEIKKQTVIFRLQGKNIWDEYYTLPVLRVANSREWMTGVFLFLERLSSPNPSSPFIT